MIERGSKAVRQHADDVGISEGISAIVRAFGKENVKDIQIKSPGRRTCLKEYTADADRVCVVTKPENGLALELKKAREGKRR